LDARGFTMVVLLIVMAVMAVGMTALLPTWRQQALRGKEEELIFRGNQYARALVLYSRKNGNQLPSDIEVLYTGKYLRKKYKDPITGEDFGLLPAGQPAGAAGRGGPTPAGGQGTPAAQTPGGARGTGGLGAPSGTQIVGSIQGVYSKSTDTSIRIYQNQQRYIDWPFTVQTAQLQMGSAARGGGPGAPGAQPGRGNGAGGGQQPPGRGTPTPGGGRGVDGGAPGRGGQPAPARGGAPVGAPTGGRGRGNSQQ
jgi:type II secretory pathway pseudopilin PulG